LYCLAGGIRLVGEHQDFQCGMYSLGAMAELGGHKPQEARFVQSWITNANKVFAVFRP